MSIPVQTQILDKIEERLNNITITNEYFHDLLKLKRASLEPFQNDEMPAINFYSTGDVLEKKMNSGIRQRVMSIIIEFYTKTRDEVFVDVSNKLSADILIALERDVSAPAVSDAVSHSLGGIVSQLEEAEVTPAIGSGQTPYCGVIVVLNVTYRVNRHDPFTLIN